MSLGRSSGSSRGAVETDIFGRKKQPSSRIIVCVENTKYPAIQTSAKSLGWAITYSNEEWDIYWTDSGNRIERYVKQARSYQRINHFPGMIEIYRKNNLARVLMAMRDLNKISYDFFPRSWTLPQEYRELVRYVHSTQLDEPECFIVKPSAGAQGKGIHLSFSPHELNPNQDAIVQTYIQRPLLIDGLKFDLRIYALVVCCDPLRVLVYREGLVRLCTAKYEEPDHDNLQCAYMHLTNYSVNKSNENFVQNNSDCENTSSKRSLKWLRNWLDENGMESNKVWSNICDVVVKTLISIQPSLAEAYRDCKSDKENQNPFTCFEILGFDVMLTEDGNPVLIEVNHTPSFRTDSAFDGRVKQGLIQNTLNLLNMNVNNRLRHHSRASALSQVRLYGDTFTANSSGCREPVQLETDERKWEKYLANEQLNLGDFDLAYPTDRYEDQPTAQFRLEYEELLSQSQEAYDEHRKALRNQLNGSTFGAYTFVGSDDVDDDDSAGIGSRKRSSKMNVQGFHSSGSSFGSSSSRQDMQNLSTDSANGSEISFSSMEANMSSSDTAERGSTSKGVTTSRSFERNRACLNLAEMDKSEPLSARYSTSEPCMPDLNYMKAVNVSMSSSRFSNLSNLKRSPRKRAEKHKYPGVNASDSRIHVESRASVASLLMEKTPTEASDTQPHATIRNDQFSVASSQSSEKSLTDGLLSRQPSQSPTEAYGFSSTASLRTANQRVVPQYSMFHNRLPNSLRSIQSQQEEMQSQTLGASAKSSGSNVKDSYSSSLCDLPSMGSKELVNASFSEKLLLQGGFQASPGSLLTSSQNEKSQSIHSVLENQMKPDEDSEGSNTRLKHMHAYPPELVYNGDEKAHKKIKQHSLQQAHLSVPTSLPLAVLPGDMLPGMDGRKQNEAHSIMLNTETPEIRANIRLEVSKLFPGSYSSPCLARKEDPCTPGIIHLSKVSSSAEKSTIHAHQRDTLVQQSMQQPTQPPMTQSVTQSVTQSLSQTVPQPVQQPAELSMNDAVVNVASPPQGSLQPATHSPGTQPGSHDPTPPTSKPPTSARTQFTRSCNPDSSSDHANVDETANPYTYPRRGRTYSETSNHSESVDSTASTMECTESADSMPEIETLCLHHSAKESIGDTDEPSIMTLGVPQILAPPPPIESVLYSPPPLPRAIAPNQITEDSQLMETHCIDSTAIASDKERQSKSQRKSKKKKICHD